MAKRRRLRKPLLPGLWSVLAALALLGSIGGLFWLLGRSTECVRVNPAALASPPVPAVAKGK